MDAATRLTAAAVGDAPPPRAALLSAVLEAIFASRLAAPVWRELAFHAVEVALRSGESQLSTSHVACTGCSCPGAASGFTLKVDDVANSVDGLFGGEGGARGEGGA